MKMKLKWFSVIVILVLLLQFVSVPAYAVKAEELSSGDVQNQDSNLSINELNCCADNTSNLLRSSRSQKLTRVKNIVLFIKFQGDEDFVDSNKIQMAETHFNTGPNSLKQYVSTMSYGELTVDSFFLPRDEQNNVITYEDSHPSSYYLEYAEDGTNIGIVRYIELLNNILTQNIVKEQIEAACPLDQLDDDINSIILTVVTSSGSSVWGSTLWASVGGVQLPTGTTIQGRSHFNLIRLPQNYLNSPDDGTLVHEFLHIMNLRDLYRNGIGTPVGLYSIMANTRLQNMLQYEQRNVLGWGTPIDEFTTGGQFTLKVPAYQDKAVDGGVNDTPETAIILKSPSVNDEFFVVEYRGNAGYDENASYMVDGVKHYLWQPGLLVYRINKSLGGRGNVYSPPDYIHVFRPGETGPDVGDGDMGNATLSYNRHTSFGKSFSEESEGFDGNTIYFSNGNNSGIEINLVDNQNPTDDSTITFNVTYHSRGEGTQENPYLLTSLADFSLLGEYPDKYFKLAKDIDATKTRQYYAVNFGGVLDGDGHAITGLNLQKEGSLAASIINQLQQGGKISNLTIINPILSSQNTYGGIIAQNSGIIENVKVIGGEISSTLYFSSIGSIAGYTTQSSIIRDCFSSTKVTGGTVGGIVGVNNGTVDTCISVGKVTGVTETSQTGGLIGDNTIRSINNICTDSYWLIIPSGQTVGALGESYIPGKNVTDGIKGINMVDSIELISGTSYLIPAVQTADGTLVNGLWSASDFYYGGVQVTPNGVITAKRNCSTSIFYNININGTIFNISIPVTASGIENEEFILVTKINSNIAVLNGTAGFTTYNNGAYQIITTVNGTTMAPIRFVAESAGLTVDWDGTTGAVTICNPVTGEYLVLQLNSTTLIKYNADNVKISEYVMTMAPMTINGSTYIPIRSIAEGLGFQVEYREHEDGKAYVIITNRIPALTQTDVAALCNDAILRIEKFILTV